jgi:hypothetical protein
MHLLLAAALVVAATLLPVASGHAFLSEPAARNYRINWNYCPHCGAISCMLQLQCIPLPAQFSTTTPVLPHPAAR